MITGQKDTNPEIEKAFITLFKKLTISEKFYLTDYISTLASELSRNIISNANPRCDKEELNLLFVKYHYGEELAIRFESFLRKRNETNKTN